MDSNWPRITLSVFSDEKSESTLENLGEKGLSLLYKKPNKVVARNKLFLSDSRLSMLLEKIPGE